MLTSAHVSSAIFLLLTAAVFLLFGLDSVCKEAMEKNAMRSSKVRSFRKKGSVAIAFATLKSKRDDLISCNKLPSRTYRIITLLCGLAGFFAGRMVFHSLLISISVAAFGTVLPLFLLSYLQTKEQTARLERLASSMMILSNSYIVTEDFITSVSENVEVLEYPKPFRDFLTYVTLMDSDTESALRRMERSISNRYFSQWIDALVMAQQDRALKYVTVAVVDSMHDMLQSQQESDAAMHVVWQEYLLTLVMIFSVPLIFKILMPEAYIGLCTTVIGQGLFALLLLAVFYSVIRALQINKPLTQKGAERI